MSDNTRGTPADIDIDALLQDTWLQVISLRHNPQFNDGEGRVLWERCVADVERVQLALKDAGLDDASCRHVLITQCALIDETVKSRGIQDDACVQWYDIPLQGHFLGTIDAGDTLCDQIREVLLSASRDAAVKLGVPADELGEPDEESLRHAVMAVRWVEPAMAAAWGVKLDGIA